MRAVETIFISAQTRHMDVLTLSRIQFGATVGFHYIYPPLSIGLGIMLVIMEAAWLRTKKPIYHQMARFWTKVFALTLEPSAKR
jgi:cytochrome bd ubiquinol oxidase subunit I